MTTVSFSVVGIPVGQGSKRPFVHKGTGKVVMTEGATADAAEVEAERAEIEADYDAAAGE